MLLAFFSTSLGDSREKMSMNDYSPQKNPHTARLYLGIAHGVAVVAAVFSLVVCVLIVINFIMRESTPLLDSPALEKLLTELRDNPADLEMKDQIRTLDLLTRKAFFTSVAFTKAGALLLCIGVALLLASLKAMAVIQRRLPDPGKFEITEDTGSAEKIGRWTISVVGVVLVLVCLIMAFRAETGLDSALESRSVVHKDMPSGIEPEPAKEEFNRNWAGFRGPGGRAVAYHAGVPVEWDGKTGKNILWKTPVPLPGFSSPIVWDNRLFLSGGSDALLEVYCFDTETGKMLWRREVRGSSGSPAQWPEVTEDTGYAASTMTTDGRLVFAVFATGDIICMDFAGNRVWARNFGVPDNMYGHASSLIAHDGRLFVQYDQVGGGHLFALKTDNGMTIWERNREVKVSWASPIIIETGGRVELILNGNPLAVSYDPSDGTENWSIECMSGEVAPSPAFAGGIVYVTTAYSILAAIKANGPAEIIWQTDEDLPDASSPLATGKHVFIAASYGTVTCFDALTGEVLWKKEFDEGFYSSPVLADGRVYLMDKSGLMHIFADDREYKLLATAELGEESTCTPAFLKGRIYIRGKRNLYCIAGQDNLEANIR